MAKYFKNVKSFEDLKNQFKALARKNHPDAGGDVEIMKVINTEYDALFPIWKDRHNSTAEPQEQTTETADSTRSEFYTANGWKGSRYDSALREKDICKIIRVYIKEKYPTWKFSVNCAGGGYLEHVNIAVMEAPQDIFDPEYFSTPCGEWYKNRIRTDCWDMERMKAENDIYMQLHSIRERDDCLYLNDVGYAVLKDVYDFMMSFNYDDSDGMIDYFDRGFYESFNIGKWNKSFKIVPKTARVKKKASEPAKSRKKSAEPKKETAPEIEQKTGYTYKTTKGEDTRDGSVLWIVRIVETLDNATYIAENKAMQKRGGYYSKFKHGFIFRFDPTEKLTGGTAA